MKIVIADTGALISLGHIDRIDLISKLFGEFFIAQAVFDEIQNYEHPDFDKTVLNPHCRVLGHFQ